MQRRRLDLGGPRRGWLTFDVSLSSPSHREISPHRPGALFGRRTPSMFCTVWHPKSDGNGDVLPPRDDIQLERKRNDHVAQTA